MDCGLSVTMQCPEISEQCEGWLDVEAGDNHVLLGGSHFFDEDLQGFHSDSHSEN